MRRSLPVIAVLATICTLLIGGRAAADDLPTLGATLTCDTAAGTMSIRSGEIGANDDRKASPSGGLGTAVRSMSRLLDHPFVCELKGHRLDVGVGSYDAGGHPRGECGAWESGDYVVRMDRHEFYSFGIGNCREEEQHAVELRIAQSPSQKDVPIGTDCLTIVGGMSSNVPAEEHCGDIQLEEPRAAPGVPRFGIALDGNPKVCAAVARALRMPQPPPSADNIDLGSPNSRFRQIDTSQLFGDRHFLRWHQEGGGNALDPLDGGADWAWTVAPLTNDGHKWLVRQQHGFARAWLVPPKQLRGRDWSDPESYKDLKEPGMRRVGLCPMQGNPLEFPVMLSSESRKPDGRLCESTDLYQFKQGQLRTGGTELVRDGTDTIQLMTLGETVYVLYESGASGVSQLRGTFYDEPASEGGLGPASATIRVVRFQGATYQDECLIATGALPKPGGSTGR